MLFFSQFLAFTVSYDPLTERQISGIHNPGETVEFTKAASYQWGNQGRESGQDSEPDSAEVKKSVWRVGVEENRIKISVTLKSGD